MFSIKKLETILSRYPAYRLKQAKKSVFIDLIDNWQKATVLPEDMRSMLNQELPLSIDAQIIQSKKSESVKVLITFIDGLQAESVLMSHQDGRNTVCVSSQIGCPIGCSFCATGQMGFRRNLETDEIIAQILFFSRYLKEQKKKISNVVFMGMGEPFLNYENVLSAIKIINSEDYFNIGARHISVSTVGLPDKIRKFANENMQINLAISLHAPTDDLRSQIIPINKKTGIKLLISSVNDYLLKTNRQIMFEYLMIRDLNDSWNEVTELAKLLSALPEKLIIVNLIAYNKTSGFQPSKEKTIMEFQKNLSQYGIKTTIRQRFGEDIKAACGQLAKKVKKC